MRAMLAAVVFPWDRRRALGLRMCVQLGDRGGQRVANAYWQLHSRSHRAAGQQCWAGHQQCGCETCCCRCRCSCLSSRCCRREALPTGLLRACLCAFAHRTRRGLSLRGSVLW
ncbi:hypothetical protein JKP88DRAFT_217675 [Tribonema minus]|uniref:Uncharacterized protein n=1 Tax=Tribonema minus TaxID=303371 RepID=A0A836CKJ6_9STRA|nr:hypothetical protein JKP88DRAFT_217675 [Tribonema minus]